MDDASHDLITDAHCWISESNREWQPCKANLGKHSPVQSRQSLNRGWNLAFVEKRFFQEAGGRVNPHLLHGFLLRFHSNTVGKGFNELVELYP
jgi:hypothetical protein